MANIGSNLGKLNKAQKQAVETIEGPVLVVAGPGTGKTQVLASRIAYILETTDSKPQNILCLTFTESGVAAMRQRLIGMLAQTGYRIPVHTFHSFCNEAIRTFPDKFPQFSQQPQQLTDLSRLKLMRTVLDGLDAEQKWHLRPFHNKYQYVYELNTNIQTLKREGVSVADFVKLAGAELDVATKNPKLNKKGEQTADWQRQLRTLERNVELAQIYDLYQQALAASNSYDYEDMIMMVNQQLAADDELLAHFQEQYLYILVDEYQDTNGSQNQLITQLGSFDTSPNIFAVGDDDQAIYRFQGANVGNLLFFPKQFSDVSIISLEENYRSPQSILDLAMDSIAHNQQRLVNILPELTKQLVSKTDGNALKPIVLAAETQDAELAYIVGQIKDLVASGAAYQDIAILYRRHADSEPIIDALQRSEVPVNVTAGSDAMAEPAVVQLLRLLRAIDITAPAAESQIAELLFYDWLQEKFKYSRLDVYKLLKYVRRQNYRARKSDQAIDLVDVLLSAQDHGFPKLAGMGEQLLAWRALAANANLVEFVTELLSQSGLLDSINRELNTEQLGALKSFVEFVKNLVQGHSATTLVQLLTDIELLAENGLKVTEQKLYAQDTPGVNLMTAHGAKGLEFKYVFIVKCIDGNWGGRVVRKIIKLPESIFNVPDQDEAIDSELEDERRLFFVAATRAQTRLWITHAAEYIQDGEPRPASPSQFVTELNAGLYTAETAQPELGAAAEFVLRSLMPMPLLTPSGSEAKYLQALVADFRLSASAMNDYIECPLKFMFTRLLNIPTPANRHLVLGNAVHKALELFSRKLMLQESVELSYLQDQFAQALEREFVSGELYQELMLEGNQILNNYYQHYQGAFAKPAAVEYNFARHNIVLDLPSMDPVVLSGKIDKLEWVNEEEVRVKIVDYKTSTPKSENQIKGLNSGGDKSILRQMVFYELMAGLDDQFRPLNKMQKYVIDRVEVDFLKPTTTGKYQKISLNIQEVDVAELKTEIADVMQNIRALNFFGVEAYPLCGKCDYCQFLSASRLNDLVHQGKPTAAKPRSPKSQQQTLLS